VQIIFLILQYEDLFVNAALICCMPILHGDGLQICLLFSAYNADKLAANNGRNSRHTAI